VRVARTRIGCARAQAFRARGRRGPRRNAPLPRFLILERPRYFVILPRPPASRAGARRSSVASIWNPTQIFAPSLSRAPQPLLFSLSRAGAHARATCVPVPIEGVSPSVTATCCLAWLPAKRPPPRVPLPRATSFSRADPPANHRAATLPLVAGFAFSSYRSL
jgi:hypothetical protein